MYIGRNSKQFNLRRCAKIVILSQVILGTSTGTPNLADLKLGRSIHTCQMCFDKHRKCICGLFCVQVLNLISSLSQVSHGPPSNRASTNFQILEV